MKEKLLNQLRIWNTDYLYVHNCLKLRRWNDARTVLKQFIVMTKVWQKEQKSEQEACLKGRLKK